MLDFHIHLLGNRSCGLTTSLGSTLGPFRNIMIIVWKFTKACGFWCNGKPQHGIKDLVKVLFPNLQVLV